MATINNDMTIYSSCCGFSFSHEYNQDGEICLTTDSSTWAKKLLIENCEVCKLPMDTTHSFYGRLVCDFCITELKKQKCWFQLVNENKIIAECSVTIEYKYNQARIDDVFVPSKYRGNGYSYLLLNKVIKIIKRYSIDVKFKLESIYLSAIVGNIPANKTYEKIFGLGQQEDEIIFYSLNV